MTVVSFQHVKPGKGAAFVRTKMKNVITGAVVETSFNPTAKFEEATIERKTMEYSYADGNLYYFMDPESYELIPIDESLLGDSFKFVTETSFNPTAKFEQAFVERKDMEYSYNDGDLYYFMDMETYDMLPISKDVLGDAFRFVKENMTCKVLSYKGNVFGVEAPNFVDLEVTETEPGFAGNTATNVTKPATLETGAEIKVPLFINIGDKITIDTRTGEYLSRCKN